MAKLVLLSFALALQTSVASAAGDAAAGKRVFVRCASCHEVGPAAKSGFGPHLTGIIGRPAAAAKDFAGYSPALRNSRIVWSEPNLKAFIKAPGKVVPGNGMRFFGIGDDRRIDDLLAYLRTVQ